MNHPLAFGNWLRTPAGQLIYNGADGLQYAPLYDDNLHLVGWSQIYANGRHVFIPYQGDAKLKPVTDETTGKAVSGHFIDSQGNVVDSRATMQQQGIPALYAGHAASHHL